MKLVSSAVVAVVAALVACGGKSSPPVSPLPPDPTPAQPPAAAAQPAEPPAVPEPPRGPLEVTIPAQQTTVKLVNKGKGKLAPLRYTAKAGGKQQVEVAMDFTATQTEGASVDSQIVPTIVLLGDAETTAVDAAGTAKFALTVRGTDARDVQGSKVSADQFRKVLGSLGGMVIGGSVDSTGNPGDTTLRVEQPDDLAEGALELIRLTLPGWPVLPKEPIGVGAKWQATTTSKLADKLVVTQTTDYELIAHKGATWSIKGITKVSGADQTLDNGKVSAIGGSGTTEVTLADGALYPTHKNTLETKFTASEADKSVQFLIKVGGAVTTK